MSAEASTSSPLQKERIQDGRLYGWVFLALAFSNGLLGYLDSLDSLTTDWDNATFPVIMFIYFVASISVILRPQSLEHAFLAALFPTTIYQLGIVYLAIHQPSDASYYSAASGASFFPQVYVGLFIVSRRWATLCSVLHCSAFFALAAFNWLMLSGVPASPLRIQSEHLLNAILLSHPTYILALRYIVRLRERLHLANNAAYEGKVEFISMLSHEIRNQMQVMVNMIDLLGLRLKDAAHQKTLLRLQASADQLHTYLKDISEFTQLDNPSLELAFETFSIHELLEEIRDEWQAKAEEKHLELSVLSASSKPPLMIHSDRARLRQVLTNLVSNGLKYTIQGHVSLRAECTGAEVRIIVADSGIGIPQSQHERIFLPRVRLENAVSEVTEGSGLGLSIVSKLVDSLGGTIEINSVPGEGARFCVVLPAASHP